MFARFARGWELMKQSWRVLWLDKELMLFPVFSSVACLLVMASFALPIVVSPSAREWVLSYAGSVNAQDGADGGAVAARDPEAREFSTEHLVAGAIAFVFYLTTTFVIVYFNTALACCAIIRFSGGNPTLGDGLRAATERLPQILGWALLSATVGTILKRIEERVPAVGKLVLGLVGMAWAVVTFLVVPILAAEKIGPFAAVKRSASLLRKTWGEALVGQVSLGAVQLLFFLPVIAGGIGAVALSVNMESILPIAIGGCLLLVYVVLLAIVFSTLQQILLAAVYQYAAAGTVPAGFSPELIESAFKRKGT